MEVFESLKANLVGKNARIVLPEGEEPRILQATKRLVKETEVIPVLLGNPEKIKIYLEIEGIEDGYEVIDPQHYDKFEEMVAALVERRKGKMTEEEARKVLVEDVNYFGVMLVYMGLVDGMVSGAIHSTAATVRPALKSLKHAQMLVVLQVPSSWFVVRNVTYLETVLSISILMQKPWLKLPSTQQSQLRCLASNLKLLC